MVFNLGLIGFQEGLAFQKKIFNDVRSGALKSAFIICRHKPVITLGRKADRKNILVSEGELKKRGIELCEVERGGDVTYHGPGQLMLYPIINLSLSGRDIHMHLRRLEEAAIGFFSDFGLATKRVKGLTGAWRGAEKIASIGICVRGWVTFYGIAMNIKRDDLPNFSLIRPCGMDIIMSSLESSLGEDVDILKAEATLIRRLENGENYFTFDGRGDRKGNSFLLVH